MIWALIVAGVAGEATIRALVGARKLGVWAGEGFYFTAIGVLSLVIAPISWSGNATLGVDALIGVVAAIVLLVATRIFLVLTTRWRAFVLQTRELYAWRDRIPLVSAVVISILAATGEELFWRGAVQGHLAVVLTPLLGALVAWALNVVVTIPARSLPVTVGTAVAGLVWSGLYLATEGVAASIACHVIWTVAMLVVPPRMSRASGDGPVPA